MENITHQKIEHLIDSLLFVPLEMKHTFVEEYLNREPDLVYSYNNNENGELTPARPGNPSYKKIAGGMVSTPTDLVKFMQALNSGRIINDSTFELMMSQPYQFASFQAYGWRYGVRGDSTVVYHHGGITRGFVTLITFDPENEMYVSVSANYDSFYDVRSDLAYFLMDLVKTTSGKIN